MQTNITEIRGGLGHTLSAFNAQNINIQFPNMDEITKNILQTHENRESLFAWADTMSKPLLENGVIQNIESLKETITQSVSFSVSIPNNLSFAMRLKMTDSLITMQKGLESISNYAEILRKAVSIPFSELYVDIFDIFNKNLTSKMYDNADDFEDNLDDFYDDEGIFGWEGNRYYVGEGPIDFTINDLDEPGYVDSNSEYHEKTKTHIFDNYVEINAEEAKIVNNELYEAGKIIINCYTITNIYVNHNYNATTPEEVETKSAWNRFLASALGLSGTVLLTWAMSGDPIKDMNITHAYNNIVEHIKHHPIKKSDLKIQLEGEQQDKIEEIDKHNIDTN